ncbi:hypothetical protein AGLY_011596, partial [Aphis glycines]
NKKFHMNEIKNPNNTIQTRKAKILTSVNNFLTSDDTFLLYGLCCTTCKLRLLVVLGGKFNILGALKSYNSKMSHCKYFHQIFILYTLSELSNRLKFKFLRNILIQIVSSKTFFTIAVAENKVIVIQNNQNNGDLIASKSSISSLVFVSGIINIINTNIDVINTLKTNTIRRQLNLSVIIPKVNLANNPGIGITAKMKPTMNDE